MFVIFFAQLLRAVRPNVAMTPHDRLAATSNPAGATQVRRFPFGVRLVLGHSANDPRGSVYVERWQFPVTNIFIKIRG